MDITIAIMLPARGGSFTDEGNNGFPMLSVVKVYDRMSVPQVVNAPRSGYVHVTGVPIEHFVQLERALEQGWDDDDGKRVAHRRWAFVASRIPAAVRAKILADRQIEITWTQLRNFIQNVKEQRNLADADIA